MKDKNSIEPGSVEESPCEGVTSEPLSNNGRNPDPSVSPDVSNGQPNPDVKPADHTRKVPGKAKKRRTSTRQNTPNNAGERKPLSDKGLPEARQLSTEAPPYEDPIAAAKQMLESSDLVGEIVRDVQACGVVGENHLILMTYLTATGRLLPKAINLCVYGHLSTGKSWIVRRVLDLLPKGEAISATQMTEKHLLNLQPGDKEKYRHKVIFIGEQTKAEVGLAFREMAESGEVSNLTVRDGDSDVSVTAGPITFILTTTQSPSDLKDEDASRMFYFPTNESEDLTDRVMQQRANRAKGDRVVSDTTDILSKHWAAQELLAGTKDNIKIVIPFADELRLPTHDPANRRLYDRILQLLEAVVFLGQFRRTRRRDKQADESVVAYADVQDWRIALPLVEVIVTQKQGLPDFNLQSFIEKLRGLGNGWFSIDDLVAKTQVSTSTLRRRIGALPTTCVTRKFDGKKALYRFDFGEMTVAKTVGLPTVGDIERHLESLKS
ncbi:MAG: hypothetical protein AABZ47_18500 [Planctomycetota bacterium]